MKTVAVLRQGCYHVTQRSFAEAHLQTVTLPHDLEGFAQDCVKAGRYGDVDAVVRAGLNLLRAQEARRVAFTRMLDDAVADADANGWHAMDDVLAELDGIIAAAETKATPG